MKLLGKIMFILLKIAGILATLIMLALTISFSVDYSEVKKSTLPLIEYSGSVYERSDLIDLLSKTVMKCTAVTAAFFVITLLMFIIGSVIKKKKKLISQQLRKKG